MHESSSKDTDFGDTEFYTSLIINEAVMDMGNSFDNKQSRKCWMLYIHINNEKNIKSDKRLSVELGLWPSFIVLKAVSLNGKEFEENIYLIKEAIEIFYLK